jgi:hypothetical protein
MKAGTEVTPLPSLGVVMERTYGQLPDYVIEAIRFNRVMKVMNEFHLDNPIPYEAIFAEEISDVSGLELLALDLLTLAFKMEPACFNGSDEVSWITSQGARVSFFLHHSGERYRDHLIVQGGAATKRGFQRMVHSRATHAERMRTL